jgi:hypothetical protein
MTAQEWIDKYQRKFNEVAVNAVLELSVRSTLSSQVERIFEDGKNTEGVVAQYSGKPGVVNMDLLPVKVEGEEVFQPIKGKNKKVKIEGDVVFQPIKGKSKKGYFGVFFEQGYKGFRKADGRDVSKVNWRMTGMLQLDYSNSQTTRQDQSITLGLKNERNIDLRQWLEEKYGQIFTLNEEERELFQKTSKFEWRRWLLQK